jgi:SnoaL-like domain
MSSEMHQLLQREKIRDALQRYARGVDRRDWTLVAQAYHPDAYDDHGGYRGGIQGLLEWLERRHATVEQSMHFLGNCLIEFVSDGCAVVETYCVVYQRYGAEAQETIRTWVGEHPLAEGERLMAELCCRYVDRFEERDGHWRIAHRTVVLEEVKAATLPMLIRPGQTVARRDRNDTLWQALGQAAP